VSLIGRLCVALGALCAAHDASAEPRRSVRFDYDRSVDAQSCPDAEAVSAGVAARLGYEPFDEHATSTIVARITRRNDTLHAT
jgi:hypothetical protein